MTKRKLALDNAVKLVEAVDEDQAFETGLLFQYRKQSTQMFTRYKKY